MKEEKFEKEWERWTPRLRDGFLFTLGFWGTVNQLFFAEPANPVLFPVLAGLLGTPFALSIDRRRRENATDTGGEHG